MRGVAARRDGAVVAPRPRPLNRDLDALPSPDYTEYFERAERLGLIAPAQRESTTIPFESARGCWWGAKSHCTFCGLNGAGMPFRSKSAERVKAELREATKRYRSWRFEAVDNILDMGLLRELLPDLIEEETGYELFYEVKANLTRHQLKLLADAGVRRIQPGIESLSTPVLRLMRKGISAIQNVNTMRWASYYGIDVQWNLLYGFPGETVDDYHQQGALISHLRHLQPPAAVGRIWMERFSPIYTDRDAFPVRHLRPHSSYSYIHPDGLDLDRVAYFFDYEFVDGIPDEELDVTKRLVDAWQAAWDGPAIPRLTFRAVDGFVQVHDRRDPAQPTTTTLGGCLATVFTALCDRPTTVRALTRELELASSRTRIEVVLTQLCEQGLVLQDGDFFLVLALPANTGR